MFEMVTSGVRRCIVFVKRPFASVAEKLAHVAAGVSTVERRLVSLVFLCAFTRDIESEMLHLERKCKRSVGSNWAQK